MAKNCWDLILNGESISDICRRTGCQICHLCERVDCCDNDNPLVRRIKELEEKLKIKKGD